MDGVDRIPIYLLDDDPGVRSSLTELLRALDCGVHSFGNAGDLLRALPALEPGIFLIDLRLGAESGLDVLRALTARQCRWPAAIITAHGDIPLAVEAVRIGAFDFVEKPFETSRLRDVLETGRRLLPAAIERTAQARDAQTMLASLSQRQRQVLDGIVEGLTSKEIALRHGLSHRTVEAYRGDMMAKLGMQNMAELFRLVALTRDGDV